MDTFVCDECGEQFDEDSDGSEFAVVDDPECGTLCAFCNSEVTE